MGSCSRVHILEIYATGIFGDFEVMHSSLWYYSTPFLLDSRYTEFKCNMILNTTQRNEGKTLFRLWTHKGPRPYGRAMGYELFGETIPWWEIESVLYSDAVLRGITIMVIWLSNGYHILMMRIPIAGKMVFMLKLATISTYPLCGKLVGLLGMHLIVEFWHPIIEVAVCLEVPELFFRFLRSEFIRRVQNLNGSLEIKMSVNTLRLEQNC